MQEDDLIFLGAAILLAPTLTTKTSVPQNDLQIQTAVAYAHFLHEEVKNRRDKIRDQQAMGYTGLIKKTPTEP